MMNPNPTSPSEGAMRAAELIVEEYVLSIDGIERAGDVAGIARIIDRLIAADAGVRLAVLEEALQIAVKRAQYHADIINGASKKGYSEPAAQQERFIHHHRANEAKEIADAIRALQAERSGG